jgi:hypothetical protein
LSKPAGTDGMPLDKLLSILYNLKYRETIYDRFLRRKGYPFV